MKYCVLLLIGWLLPCLCLAAPQSQDSRIHTFERKKLTNVYFSEGASAGDINKDGAVDAVYGPHWYEGPDFKIKHEIYAAKPQPTAGYADHFFSWVHDFNGDGWDDVFVVGFPATPAYVYENPTDNNLNRHWKKHEVFDSVSNESPQLIDLVEDERPELVCTRHGIFGYATVNWDKPFESWTFHPISGRITAMKFGHGLGVGDVNGDGLKDVLHANGWIEQPANPKDRWIQHTVKFSNSYGGAEMHAYDVDGDGDNDVITSLAAHDFGLAWYEQTDDGSFRQRLIMGSRPEENKYGIVFSEPHSVQLTDMDGDGLKDIVTGKTYYSHHQKSPLWNAGAVVYWFRLVRAADGIDWIPYLANGVTGIGRQISISDVNGDQWPDIVVGGMKGGNVLIQRRESVSRQRWQAAQPAPYVGNSKRLDRGKPEKIDPATGKAAGAIEAESMKVLSTSTGNVGTQNMEGFKGDRWSGGKQLFWSQATPRARLQLEFEVPVAGTYDIETSFTVAPDFAIINVLLDNKALGEPLDLFNYPEVQTTGALILGRRSLKAGPHKLTLETIGAHDSAVPSFMVGFDYLRLVPVSDTGNN